MTRDEAKKLLPIISAFADGATVEMRIDDEWSVIERPNFGGEADNYRIAPAPKLRPWTREELEDVICRGSVVRHKRYGSVSGVSIDYDGEAVTKSGYYSFAELADVYELIGIDGARLPEPEPCGVRE